MADIMLNIELHQLQQIKKTSPHAGARMRHGILHGLLVLYL